MTKHYSIKELAEAKGTSAPVRAALLALEARVLDLEDRLEIPQPPFEGYDGISCRDETIRLLDAQVAKWKALAETLAGALGEVWKEATAMRNSSKTVGHYHTDHKLNQVYHRTRYHAGKKIMEILKPARQALTSYKEMRDVAG